MNQCINSAWNIFFSQIISLTSVSPSPMFFFIVFWPTLTPPQPNNAKERNTHGKQNGVNHWSDKIHHFESVSFAISSSAFNELETVKRNAETSSSASYISFSLQLIPSVLKVEYCATILLFSFCCTRKKIMINIMMKVQIQRKIELAQFSIFVGFEERLIWSKIQNLNNKNLIYT